MFSVRVEWSDLENYLQQEFKQEIVHVPGDGVCFLKSVKHCLERDLDVNYTIDKISDKIFDEICDYSKMYTVFHTNSKRQLISDTLKYLNHRMYTMDIVDVVVQACANALKINLYMSHFSNSCKPKEKNEICRSVSTRAVKCDGLFFVLQHGFQYGFQHA